MLLRAAAPAPSMTSHVSCRCWTGERWSIRRSPPGCSSVETMACAQQIDIGLEPAADTASRIEASLELDFEFNRATGRTVLAASRQQAPLQVVRAFQLEDGAALAHLHNVSGGLLGGDGLELRTHVGAGASAQLTPPAPRASTARANKRPTP